MVTVSTRLVVAVASVFAVAGGVRAAEGMIPIRFTLSQPVNWFAVWRILASSDSGRNTPQAADLGSTAWRVRFRTSGLSGLFRCASMPAAKQS